VVSERHIRKPLAMHCDRIRAQAEIGEPEAAFAVGNGYAGQVRFVVARGYICVGDNGTGWIGHTAADAPIVNGFLGISGRQDQYRSCKSKAE
jgi:hypothetical protein